MLRIPGLVFVVVGAVLLVAGFMLVARASGPEPRPVVRHYGWNTVRAGALLVTAGVVFATGWAERLAELTAE